MEGTIYIYIYGSELDTIGISYLGGGMLAPAENNVNLFER